MRAGLPTHAIAGPQQCSSRAAVTGDLHFFVFETKQIEDVLTFFARYWPEACKRAGVQAPLIRATGGGSYKHAELFKRAGTRKRAEPCDLRMAPGPGSTSESSVACCE